MMAARLQFHALNFALRRWRTQVLMMLVVMVCAVVVVMVCACVHACMHVHRQLCVQHTHPERNHTYVYPTPTHASIPPPCPRSLLPQTCSVIGRIELLRAVHQRYLVHVLGCPLSAWRRQSARVLHLSRALPRLARQRYPPPPLKQPPPLLVAPPWWRPPRRIRGEIMRKYVPIKYQEAHHE